MVKINLTQVHLFEALQEKIAFSLCEWDSLAALDVDMADVARDVSLAILEDWDVSERKQGVE